MTKRKDEQRRIDEARANVAEATGRAFVAMLDAERALGELHALGSKTAAPFAERLLRMRFDFHAYRNELNYSQVMG